MTSPSPDFRINGGAVGVKAAVTAGSTVTCLLDSVTGVNSTQWSIIRTDDTSTAAQWNATFVQSGAVGQQLQFTALAAGQACIVQAQINSGLIAGQVSSESRATAKVYIETAEGLEVLTSDELVNTALESNPTHGAVEPINAVIRAAGGAVGAYKPPVKACTAVALPAYTRVGNVITANAVGAFSCDALMTWAVGDTFLLKDGASGVDNGVYALDVVGSGATAWQATRVWWMDESAEVVSGCLIPVTQGATHADEVFQLTTNPVIVINTTALTFSLWAGYWDRTGTVVHPEATGDAVVIGGTAVLGTEKLRVVGAIAATTQILVSGAVGDQGIYAYGDDFVGLCLASYKTAAFPHAMVNLWAARGTGAAPSQLVANDYVATLSFRGYTSGGSFLGCARIDALALENFTGAAVGSQLLFATAATGSIVETTRLTIDATAAAFSVPLIVDSAGSGSFATTGDIRLPDVCSCYAWGTGPVNVPIFTKDAADNLGFGNNTISPSTFLLAADNLQFYCGATQTVFINASLVDFKIPLTLLAAGYIRLGLLAGSGAGSASATGTIRLQHGASIKGRNLADGADWNILSWGVSGTNQWYLGDTTPGDATIRVGSGYAVSVISGAAIVDLRSAGSSWYCKMGLYNRTVAQITALGGVAGDLLFCSNEAGGATVVYHDGANWRRVYDNAVMS